MPVSHIGFKLKPVGFFDGNPALDLPPSDPAHCHHHGNGNGASNGR
jgi:primary-amine oxidase